MTNERLWVRQGTAVKGPFPFERVLESIQAGSLRDDMDFSLDGRLWVPGDQCLALFADARPRRGALWLVILNVLHAALCVGSALWLWHIVPIQRSQLQQQWDAKPGWYGWTEASIARQMATYDELLLYGWIALGVGALSLVMAAFVLCRGRVARSAQFVVSGIGIAFALYGALKHGVDILPLGGIGLQVAILWMLLRPHVRTHHLAATLTKPRKM